MPKVMEIVSNIKNIATLVTALAAAGGTFYGAQAYLNKTYASVNQVEKLEIRLSLQELKELRNESLEELFFWRKQVRKNPDDIDVKKKLKEAEEYVEDVKRQIKELEK